MRIFQIYDDNNDGKFNEDELMTYIQVLLSELLTEAAARQDSRKIG